ncbi:PfkB family carbohydrate kinase [Mycobacterium sp. Aquia_213]|uniref:PfkB family carbohydrate kinase n=1 Tax=Mycobacterium sp. Aquia_213 TaxID=2991728 RepID=UPI00226D6DD2|nr:PfkB family carbohydrate kinase [Mycobacterium sp. Aquia_213]WAC92226.1 PfkB family carbohydrate kinase [Mycobacterium sp. Aquia_213]
MRIVGGAYRERCANPRHDALIGSGMRAAASLAESGGDVELTTAVHESEQLEAGVVADTLGVTVDMVERTRPVSFAYFTPLNAPVIGGLGSRISNDISVEGDAVLLFGLIESGQVRAKGQRVVVDPQRPRNLTEEDLPEVEADEQAWVLNERETTQLAGVQDVFAAARRLVEARGLSVVVTKRGPQGALVTTADGHQVNVGACVTESVFPIGSGDVFAGTFAWAWADKHLDPVDAANIASNAAAHWCETKDFATPAYVLDGTFTRELVPTIKARPVYLAGPFFNLQQRWLVDVVNASLAPHVWSPSHEIGAGGIEVARQDLDGLELCDSVLALLDDNDQGTVFEVGYATKMDIPVVMYTEHVDAEGSKMLLGTGTTHYEDLSTAVYKSQWAAAFRAAARESG